MQMDRSTCKLEALKASVMSRRDSGLSLLTDPSVQLYLSHVFESYSEDEVCKDDNADKQRFKAMLRRKIDQYNMRNGSFTASFVEGVLYEGIVKFSYHHSNHQVTKLMKITSAETVESLIPVLNEQLRLPPQQPNEQMMIYQVAGSDEILLSSEECPLEVAVNSHRNVTFQVKMAMRNGSSLESISSGSSNRKALSNFFGVNENELAVAFSSSLSGKSASGASDFEPSATDDVSLHSSSSSNSLSESLSRLKRSPRLFSSNNGTGLWLRDKTPTFKRKGPMQPAFSDKNLSVTDGQNSPKRKAKSRGITALLENGLNLKKRQNGKTVGGSGNQDEGLFKLHANFPEAECTCRRVFVDKFSKSEDVVRDFLDLSSVSYDSYKDFVLCDVVGWYHSMSNPSSSSSSSTSESKLMRRASVGWKEECFRTLDDKEHPLVVQSLWVPGHGRSRRFEIRRKTDVVQENGDLAFFDLVNGRLEHRPDNEWDHFQGDDGILDKLPISTSSSPENQRSKLYRPTTSEREDTESSDENAASSSPLLPPRDHPYIVCIQGYSAEKDLLFHILNKETIIIGNQLSARAESSTSKSPDIHLHGPDILLQHCILTCHHVTDLDSSSFNLDKYLVTLEACSGGKLSLNGFPVDQEMELRPGDLISVGSYYHFILRDATSKCQSLFGLRWMTSNITEGDGIYADFPHLAKQVKRYEDDTERWKVAYKVEHEDDLVDFMTSLIREEEGGNFGLASGHLFLMIVEYASYTQGSDHTKLTLVKVANALLGIAENKAKEMATTHSNSTSKPSMESLAPDLKVLLVALTNSLELLNCLQSKLPDYLPQENNCGKREAEAEGDEDSSGCSDSYQEVLSILEEVVMYSFQQCVYYITKTLYDALPTLLSANPFSETDEACGVSNIIWIFQKTLDLLTGVCAHPDIISQLYAYLLFFMNAALFNVLLEKAASGKYLKWSKGVQIRGNLDIVESWIMEKGLDDQIHFLQTVSSAADLLATPKIQLMQATWSSLRNDFSSLRPAQLHQLLSKYELSKSAKCQSPAGWNPIGEDVEQVKQRETILESFEEHPPLTLPSGTSKLDLNNFHNLPSFHRFLEYLRQDLPFVHVYQGASRVSSRRQSQTSNRSEKDLVTRAKFSPEKVKEKPSSPARHTKEETHIYASVNFDEKRGVLHVDCNDNITKGVNDPSKVTEDVALEAKILEEKPVASPPVKHSSKKFRKHRHRKKSPSSIKQGDKGQRRDTTVASEEEASKLLEAYFTGVSGGYFDSIPEEEYDESSGVEDFPLLDDVPELPVTSSLHEKLKGNSISSSDDAVPSSEGSSSIKEEFHDSAVENFDPVTYAGGINKSGADRKLSSSSDQSSSSKSEKPSSGKSPSKRNRGRRTSLDDVFVVDLIPENDQLGIRFADGMKTPLATPGVYVRGFVPHSAAASCDQLKIGDRILAVDGSSLVSFEYDQAIKFINQSRERHRFLVARSDANSVMRLTAPITAI